MNIWRCIYSFPKVLTLHSYPIIRDTLITKSLTTQPPIMHPISPSQALLVEIPVQD